MKPNLALVIRAPGEVALEERPIPTPGPGEVLVRVQYTAVCGSDRKLAEGHYTCLLYTSHNRLGEQNGEISGNSFIDCAEYIRAARTERNCDNEIKSHIFILVV